MDNKQILILAVIAVFAFSFFGNSNSSVTGFQTAPTYFTVYAGWDNNGNTNPDCWLMDNSSCTMIPVPSGGLNPDTQQGCVNAVVNYYSSQGYSLKSWGDTGQNGYCLPSKGQDRGTADSSSDRLEIVLMAPQEQPRNDVPPVQPSCSDSDGLDLGRIGMVSVVTSYGTAQVRDDCAGDYVREYYCVAGQLKSTEINCLTFDRSCSNGACI